MCSIIEGYGHSFDRTANHRAGLAKGSGRQDRFLDLPLDDIVRTADIFRPVYERRNGVDGRGSIEVPPLLALETANTIEAAKELLARAGRPNVFVKLLGTQVDLLAIEEGSLRAYPST